jgi:hypothetical protein
MNAKTRLWLIRLGVAFIGAVSFAGCMSFIMWGLSTPSLQWRGWLVAGAVIGAIIALTVIHDDEADQ